MKLVGRARARDRRRRRRLRGRRRAQRPRRRAARSSPSSPAATSISPRFAVARRRLRPASTPIDHHHEPYSTPLLPERITRLDELAVDLWWSWHPEAREVFRRLDYTLWRATAHNPVRMLLARSRASKLERGGRRPGVPGALRPRDRRARRRARRAQHLVVAAASRSSPGSRSPTSPPSSRCTSRCRSTPAASACSPAITARKPSDLGVPLDRRRLHVSAGLLPPARLRRRLAGRELRAAQLGRRADRAGD